MWVITPCIGGGWGVFHHRVARRLAGSKPCIGRYGLWVYTAPEDTMAEAVFQEVETYVSHLQNTVAQFIATRPIMDLCLAAERRSGSRVSKQW